MTPGRLSFKTGKNVTYCFKMHYSILRKWWKIEKKTAKLEKCKNKIFQKMWKLEKRKFDMDKKPKGTQEKINWMGNVLGEK